MLSNKAIDLFKVILDDWNTNTQKAAHIQGQRIVNRELKEQGLILSQARKFFVTGLLKLDDHNELKCECQAGIRGMKEELHDIPVKFRNIDKRNQLEGKSFKNIFQGFSGLDATDKKHLVNLIPPHTVNFQTGDIVLSLNNALLKVLLRKR